MLRFKPKPMLWLMLFALLSLGGAVFAQDATGSSGLLSALLPSLTGVLGGTDAIVGVVITFALTIMPSNWPWKVKTNVTWLVCLAMAVIVTLAQGKLTGDFSDMTVISAKFAFILTVAKNFYDGALKSTIGPALAKLTDPKDAREQQAASTPAAVNPPPAFDETPTSGFNIPTGDFNIGDFNIGAPNTSTSSEPKIDLSDDALNRLGHVIGGVVADAVAKRL